MSDGIIEKVNDIIARLDQQKILTDDEANTLIAFKLAVHDQSKTIETQTTTISQLKNELKLQSKNFNRRLEDLKNAYKNG